MEGGEDGGSGGEVGRGGITESGREERKCEREEEMRTTRQKKTQSNKETGIHIKRGERWDSRE